MKDLTKTVTDLGNLIADLLVKTGKPAPPVILCIGSDRVTGDSVGPLVGTMLKNFLNLKAFVYGDVGCAVTALNIGGALRFISEKHYSSPVIAVDASLGKKCDVGAIRVISGGIKPGLATGKNLAVAGDIGITATVTEYKNADMLSSVSPKIVIKLSEIISRAILQSVEICFAPKNRSLCNTYII